MPKETLLLKVFGFDVVTGRISHMGGAKFFAAVTFSFLSTSFLDYGKIDLR